MDYPCCPEARAFAHGPRTPVSLWGPIAIIALVLGAASVASALTTDTRDIKERAHPVAPAGRAL